MFGWPRNVMQLGPHVCADSVVEIAKNVIEPAAPSEANEDGTAQRNNVACFYILHAAAQVVAEVGLQRCADST
eukprot:84730-Pyramimonas_sp.AAC.3